MSAKSKPNSKPPAQKVEPSQSAAVRPRQYWFKAKSFGWGWTPATWQGWVILIGILGLAVVDFLRIDSQSHSSSDTWLSFGPDLMVWLAVLIGICWATGEKPRWRWGR